MSNLTGHHQAVGQYLKNLESKLDREALDNCRYLGEKRFFMDENRLNIDSGT